MTNNVRSTLLRQWSWLGLLLIILLTTFIRFRLLDMPLERDEGEYAYSGQLILEGIPPYQLAYNMKLPGTYYACAAGMAVFGQTAAGLHLTLLTVNGLTVLFVFLLGRRLFGELAGLVAAASYAIMSVSPVVLGMAAHANHFVVLFAVPATLLLWQGQRTNRLGLLFLSGLFFGVALLMKQQGVVFGVFGGIYLVWARIQNRNPVGICKPCFWFGTGLALPFGVLCLTLVRAGVFHAFWFWTFTYAHSYVSLLSWHEGVGRLWEHLKAGFQPSAGFWLLAGIGLCLGLADKNNRGKTFFVATFGVFSFLGTATGLYFRGHYFILVLPAVSLLVGLGVSSWQIRLRLRQSSLRATIIALSLFGLVFSWSIYFQRDFF